MLFPEDRGHRSLAEISLFISLPLILLFLLIRRPPTVYYALPLAPIALAALLFEFSGGTLAALTTLAGVAALIALDADAARRSVTLQEAWPILILYLVVGPLVGWLAAREREAERSLISAARHLQAVTEISQAITSSLDLEETLRTVLAETRRLVPYTRAAVLLREGDELRIVAVRGPDEEEAGQLVGRKFSIQNSAAGASVRSRRRWAGGPLEAARYPDTQLLCPVDQPCIILPLVIQRKTIGAFFLGGPALGDSTRPALDQLDSIASQMAIAIEHARLFTSEHAWSEQLTAISDASREIAAALDLDRTLRLVMAKAAETLPMDAGALFQLDSESHTYQVAVSANLSPDQVARITFDFQEGVPGWVAKNRRPLLIPEAARDPRVHPQVLREGVLSVLAVPLVARGRTVGVLNLYGKSSDSCLNEEALRLADVFASQAAYAIENARLVDELRGAASELEARVEERTRQLKDTQKQVILAEKLAVVGRLAASVAHEVNNPLQAITLQLQLIAEERAAESAPNRLVVVQQEVARISDIVQRLLDFQRPRPGQWAPLDLLATLEDVLRLADKQLQHARVETTLLAQDQVPQVWAAGDQLKQVFLNLILNGAEAMPTGGRLYIHVGAAGGSVVVSFRDEGRGMEGEVLDLLFEPFFSTKPQGTGLGLTVSQEIVNQHGGRLEVESTPGTGSTFKVILPAEGLDDAQACAESPSRIERSHD